MLAELCGGGYDRLRPNERPGWLLPFAPDMMTGTRERRRGGRSRAAGTSDREGGWMATGTNTQSRSIEEEAPNPGSRPVTESVGGRACTEQGEVGVRDLEMEKENGEYGSVRGVKKALLGGSSQQPAARGPPRPPPPGCCPQPGGPGGAAPCAQPVRRLLSTLSRTVGRPVSSGSTQSGGRSAV